MQEQQSSNSIYVHSLKLEQNTASLYVHNTGSQQCPPSYGWGPGVRNHYLLHHVVRGRGVYHCKDRRYELQAGDTFLIYPETPIHYHADPEDPWEYVWVGFGGPEARGYMDQTDFTPAEPVFHGRDSAELCALIRAVYTSCGASAWEHLEMNSRLYALLAFLIRSARRQDRPKEEDDCALLAAEYIIQHYEEPITVEGLAAYTSVSHSSLYRRFLKRFQMSPKRFLMVYRIERACALLTETNCSIQEISNSVGFEDPFYFSRAFKDLKGISPRQYANQAKSRAGK